MSRKKKKRFKMKNGIAKALKFFTPKVIPDKREKDRQRRLNRMVRKVKERKPEWDYD